MDLTLKLLSFLIPPWVIQKLIYFVIFFISGLSAHQMVKTDRELPKYFCGIIYVVNPFVYARVLAGHWLLLLGYAITPLLIRRFLGTMENPKVKEITETSILLGLVGVFSSHVFVMDVIALTILFVLSTFKIKAKGKVKAYSLTILFTFFLSAFWIIPALTAKSVLYKVSTADVSAFKPYTSNFVEIAYMYGFWKPYVYAKDFIPNWEIFFVIILFVCVLGVGRKNLKFVALAVIAFLLSMGVYDPTGLYQFCYNNVPFFKGLRDCHKFAALLALCYAYLGTHGIDRLLEVFKRGRFQLVAAFLVVLAFASPLVLSCNLFTLSDSLKPTDYPQDWYRVKQIVDGSDQDYNILFLPWHLYMSYDWLETKGAVANPADAFFRKNVIHGRNVEIAGIYSQSTKPSQQYMQSILNNITPNKLRLLNVKYIAVAKTADYQDYKYLQHNFTKVMEGEHIILYRNPLEVSRFYEQEQGGQHLVPLNYTSFDSIYYEAKTNKSAVFVPPNLDARGWTGEQKSFYLITKNGESYYQRFNLYVISYLISAISLAGIYFLARKYP